MIELVMRARPHLLLLLGAAVWLVFVAGCGGGGSDPDPGAIQTSGITKPEFIKQADEVCELGERWLLKQLGAYIDEKKHEGSKKSDAELFTEASKAIVLPRVEANIKDIASLGAPRGDETELEAYLVQMQQETNALQNKTVISQKDLFEDAYNNAGELARNYGIEACSYG